MNRINLKQKDCKFFVNKEKRTITCLIERYDDYKPVENMAFNFISEGRNGLFDSEQFNNFVAMPHRFVGVATCAATDPWNEELGKLVAYTKAKKKLMTSFFKAVNRGLKFIDEQLTRIYTEGDLIGMHFGREYERKMEVIDEQIKRNARVYVIEG